MAEWLRKWIGISASRKPMRRILERSRPYYRLPGAKGRRVGTLIRLGVLLVFFAGLGHAWLHHAHVGDGGHFSAGIEKACLSEKLVADVSASFVLAPSCFERDCSEPASDDQRRYRLDLAASPRGPPHTS